MSLTEAQTVSAHPLVRKHREIMQRLTKRHTQAYGAAFMQTESEEDLSICAGINCMTEAERKYYAAIGRSYRASVAWVRRNLRKNV